MIGFGMSAGIRPNKLGNSAAQAILRPDGRVTVRLDMTDIGTGSLTILTQVAADAMGLDPDAITIELGDSDFPATPGSGGSVGAGSSCSGLFNACVALRRAIAQAAVADERSRLWRAAATDVVFRNGQSIAGNSATILADVAARSPNSLRADGTIAPGDTYQALCAKFSTRPTSPRCRSTWTRPRCARGGCWVCSTPAAFSTPGLRDRSCSAA